MNNDIILKQDNRILSASYSLELVERRLLFLAITKLTKETKSITISLDEFRDFYGYSKTGINFRVLEAYTKELYNRSIFLLDGTNRRYTRWIIDIIFKDGTKDVVIELNPNLYPYFLDVKKNYTSYFLDETKPFKSNYTIRLYEQLKRFENNKIFKISVEDYRNLHEVESKFPLYANLKDRTIKPAIKEINEKSNYKITLKEIKKGRKVHMLEFRFKLKDKDKTNKNDIKILHPADEEPSFIDYIESQKDI